MTTTLKSLKKILLPNILKEVTLKEIFDSKPFKTSFNIGPGFEATYEVDSFKDPQGNTVDIHFIESGGEVYDVDFQVNGNSFKAKNVEYTLKEYTSLLSTIAAAVTQFLNEQEPEGLVFRGADDFSSIFNKPSKKGQKDRIYNYFITQLGPTSNYKVGKYPDGIGLQKV